MGVKCFDLIIWMNYRSKKEMCLKIGASVLIDDNWNYCHEVVYHKHTSLNYHEMKEEILNIITSFFE